MPKITAFGGNVFLHQIITGDVSWCYHYEPESKCGRMRGSMHNLRKRNAAGSKSNGDWNANSLKRLYISTKNRRPGNLSNGVIILHGNTRSYIAQMVQNLYGRRNWEFWKYPPYSHDLSPCDFYVFNSPNKLLKGRRFIWVAETVREWIRKQPQVYQQGIQRPVINGDF